MHDDLVGQLHCRFLASRLPLNHDRHELSPQTKHNPRLIAHSMAYRTLAAAKGRFWKLEFFSHPNGYVCCVVGFHGLMCGFLNAPPSLASIG